MLTAELRRKLNTFHNRCVRSMAKRRRRTSPDNDSGFLKYDALAPIYAALGVTGIDQYISSRKLRWAGHVMRMEMTRLPRMFMTSWVDAPRRNGRPQNSYGHDLTRELNTAGFNLDREAVDKGVSMCWRMAAQDKAYWRTMTRRLTDVKPIFEQARTTPPVRSSVDATALPQGDTDADRQSTTQTMTEGTTWARRLRPRR